VNLNFRKITYVLIVIVIALVAYGLYTYFKPMADSSNRNADVKISSTSMIEAFSTDASAADQTYKDKVVEITGTLKKISLQDSAAVLVFDEGGSAIIVAACKVKTSGIAEGNSVRLKGLYKGYIPGDEVFGMPAEIKIDECILL